MNEAIDHDHAVLFERKNRELKYKGKVISVYQDTLITPENKEVKWDHIEHRGAAAVVAVADSGKLLMVNQFRNSFNRITLEIPAGGRQTADEETIVCAARELEEETGYRSENLEFLISVATEIAFCNEVIDVYVARDLIPSKRNLDPDEYIDVHEYSVDELVQKIYAGEIQDSKTIAAILAYKDKYN